MLLTELFCLFLQQSDLLDRLSGAHNWYMYSCSHAKPAFCNVCREMLSGTSKGLSCEGMNNNISRVYLMFWGKHCWQVCFCIPLLNKLFDCVLFYVSCKLHFKASNIMLCLLWSNCKRKNNIKTFKTYYLNWFHNFSKFQNCPKEHVDLKALQNYLGCYHYKYQIVSGKSWSTKSYKSSLRYQFEIIVGAFSTTILPV